jgi:lipopolysaccharide/colanic/teichoic acid biosynthesis glycosyltransferase
MMSDRPDSFAMLIKRAIDVALASVGLILCSPLFIAVAIAIKLDSRGPVFFCQERVGLNRRRFTAYKFRTMVPDAHAQQESIEHLNEADGPVFKIRKDPRVTRVGAFLRQTSIDELPQLLNVFKDDMSLVGPRPLPVRDVKRMTLEWHERRFVVKPGITCLWQARSREPRFDDWIKADMEYIDQWSLSLDLKILLRTIPAVINRHGAY